MLSISKLPHIGATALVAVLAVLATGRHRWAMALVLTLLVGWGWELGQTTVLGRTARLADLAPDTLGGMLGCAWGTCAVWLRSVAERA